MISFSCPCGMKDRLKKSHFPVNCRCGRRYATPDDVSTGVDEPAVRLASPPPYGPGTELKAIFAELGIKPKASCGCQQKAAAMDKQGVEGCRKMREALIADLQASYDDATLIEKASAGIAAIAKGYPLTLGGLLDLAIEQAEKKAKPLRVAFLTPGISCGGAERWILSLCQNFDPAKVWVQAIGVEGAKHIDSMMREQVPKHIRVVTEWDNILPVAKAVDFLVVWGSPGMIDLAKVSGKPFVCAVHGADETSSYGGLVARKGIEAGGFAACVNEACLACYPPEYRDSVTVIPNGADEDRVKPISGREATRKELGISDGQKMLLYLGRIMKDKSIDQLAAVVEKLPPEWVCVLAGNTDAWGAKFIGGRMRHIPPVNHVGDLLAAADVQILLSPSEAHPLSITEGWLAGVPTVVSDLPWIRSIESQHGSLTFHDVLEADAAGLGSEQVLHAQEVARLEFTAKRMAERWEVFLTSPQGRGL